MDWDKFTTAKEIKFKSKYDKMASDIFSDAITQNETENYKPQLRGSSLPICILLHAQDLLKEHTREQTARLEHYAIQGTVFHEWYQRKLMYSKKWGKYLFGDFECTKCKRVAYKFQTRPNDYKTHICPNCKTKGLQYRELEAKYKDTVGVHVDTVLKFDENRYWVFEFKTTGSFKIKDENLEYKNKHFHQASAYPLVLEDQFGIKPERFFICYVNRDSPQHSKTSQRQHRFFGFKSNSNIMEVRQAQLDNIVAGEKARIKYFEKPTLKNLKALDDLRPCKSKSDYNEPLVGMKDKYEQNEGCPYALKAGCSCFQTEKLSKAAKDLHKTIINKKLELKT